MTRTDKTDTPDRAAPKLRGAARARLMAMLTGEAEPTGAGEVGR